MPYPIMRDDTARAWWKAWSESEDPTAPLEPPEEDVSADGDDHDWSGIVAGLIEQLESLYDRVDGTSANARVKGLLGRVRGRSRQDEGLSNERFEAKACVIIHQALPEDEALADPAFWIWLATRPGLDLIRRRYPPSEKKPIPDRNNFTSSNARETFFYRLWMRAELAYDDGRSDPYELAGYGDVDFWRSHVFRQMSTETEPLLAAFIAFQHPNGPDGEKRLSQGDIRELVKYMRRAAANIMVETLDEKDAQAFVEGQWQKIQASRSSTQAA